MRAMSYLTWPALAAPVLGPPLGGFITTYSSWRWIFFLNIPLGIAALTLALRLVNPEPHHTIRPLDWTGFALAGSSCTSLMYAMELVGRPGGGWTQPLLFLVYAVISGVLAVRHLRRTEHPILDLTALRIQTYWVSLAAGSLFRIAVHSTPFLLPLMFQVAFGLSAFQSGLLVLTMFAGNLAMKSVTTPVLRRWGFRAVLIVNGVISAVLIALLGVLSPATPKAAMITVLFLHGLSRSMQFTALNTLAFVDIPKTLMSSATSFAAVVQQMGMGLGVAVGAVALRAAGWLRGERAGVLSLTDFHLAFWMMGALGILAVVDCFTLPREAGAEVSGHQAA
jgi:MFS family permease